MFHLNQLGGNLNLNLAPSIEPTVPLVPWILGRGGEAPHDLIRITRLVE